MSPTAASGRRSSRRSVAGAVLVVLAAGAAVYGLVREAGRGRLAEESRPVAAGEVAAAPPGGGGVSEPVAGATDSSARLVTTVYYFHGDTRCVTCREIESQANEAVRSGFPEDIEAGRLRLRAVNYDVPENRHYRDDFQLSFSSVVVSRGTRYENLSDVWTLVHDERPKFDAYVVDRVSAFMKAAP